MNSFELANEGILLLDKAWKVTAANRCAQALLLSAQPRLTGFDFWEAVPIDIAEAHRGTTNTALKLSGSHQFVAHLVFEDRWIDYRFSQQESQIVVNLHDVTDTQKALLMLEDSEHRNRMLFDRNPNAMWIYDPSSLKILAANEAAVELRHRRGKIPHAENWGNFS